MAAGKRIAFDQPPLTKSESRFGTVAKYDTRRGFGFIRDDADGASVFFHITRVKGQVAPPTGSRVSYVREVGEKGYQAAQVTPGDMATVIKRNVGHLGGTSLKTDTHPRQY